jgi:hypothetical protein
VETNTIIDEANCMTGNNVTRNLAMLAVLSFALCHSMHGQSTATNTNCKSGHCSSANSKVTAAADDFAAHHKDFMRSPDNIRAVATYIEANKLDPRQRKSYEQAYKDLKKEGQLELYAK